MQSGSTARDEKTTLYPYPEGWYFVATRESILRENLVAKSWLGVEIVAWCDDDGQICVAEAVCPHMGANLGPEGGGAVRNGCLVCPFHGFEFDSTGQCVATPHAPAPRAARLRVFETREVLGMVFGWWGIDGRSVQWRLPENPPTGDDWSNLASHRFRFAGHPQETTENSVDLAHLRFIHRYDEVLPVGTVSVNGSYLKSCFDFRRRRRIAGVFQVEFNVSAVTHVHGLGYSFVEITEHSIGMHARLWVLSTPINPTEVELTLVSQIRDFPKPRRFVVGLGFVPLRLRTPLMNGIMIRAQKRDVDQDVIIWERKRYLARPRLSRADNEVAVYRRYCKQFYGDAGGQLGQNLRHLRSV